MLQYSYGLECAFLLGSVKHSAQISTCLLQADFNLTYAQLGLLPAMFMAGLMLACLVFNELCNYINSFRLIGACMTELHATLRSLAG